MTAETGPITLTEEIKALKDQKTALEAGPKTSLAAQMIQSVEQALEKALAEQRSNSTSTGKAATRPKKPVATASPARGGASKKSAPRAKAAAKKRKV